MTDDKLARVTARGWGIVVSGTLGVLVQAVKRGLLTGEAAEEAGSKTGPQDLIRLILHSL